MLEKRIQQRMDILRENDRLLQIRAEQDAQRKAEDEAYAKQIMDKLAEQDRYLITSEKTRIKITIMYAD